MTVLKRLLLAAGLAAAAAPVSADTLQEVTTRGVVLIVADFGEIPVTYKPDGTLEMALQGHVIGGKWRIDGSRLCTWNGDRTAEEACVDYPAGKASGDAFEITGPTGSVVVKIN